MDAVLQLSDHAYFLYCKGHYARSRAKYDAAIAAAAEQASLAGRGNCLVLAGLRLYSALTELQSLEQSTFTRAAFDALDARLEQVSATLRCRRDAGTLGRGRCSPLEERWYLRHMAIGHECKRTPTLVWSKVLACEGAPASRQDTVDSASLGLDLYGQLMVQCITITCAALDEELITLDEALPRFERAAEDVVAAAGFLATLQEGDAAKPKFSVVAALLQMIAKGYAPVASPAWRAAVAAHRTLERNCRLSSAEESASAKKSAQAEAQMRDVDAASAAAAAAATLRTCALASCGAREAHAAHVKVCAGCRRAVYCCREHQAADWRAHKAACKAARADIDAN